MKSNTTVETKKESSVIQKGSVSLPGLSSSHVKRKSKKQFSENVNEPMVLKPVTLVESYLDQSLQISSLNKDGMLDELQMLGDITKHLNQIINTLENIYKKDVEVKEEEDVQEDSSQKGCEDMTESLLCFSTISSQLEASFDEEREILESLAKWFGKEAQLMEELGEEEHAADSVLPMADKNILEGISKLTLCIQRLERLKSFIQNLPGHAPPSVVKQEVKKDQEKRRKLSTVVSSHKDPRTVLEDLVMKHGTEDVISMTQLFDEDAPTQTSESMNTRILEIVKVFERQTNKLQRISNEQDLLEAKYEKIKNEYQLLAEEKQIMEDEFKKKKEGENLGQEELVPAYRNTFSVKLEEKSASEKEDAPAAAAPAAAAPAAAAPAAAAPAAAAPAAAAPAAAAPAAAAPAAAAPAAAAPAAAAPAAAAPAAAAPAAAAPAAAAPAAAAPAAAAPAAAAPAAAAPAAAAPAAAAPAAAAPAAAAPAAAAPAAAAPAAAAPAAAAPAPKGRSKWQSKKVSSGQTKKENEKLKMREDLLKAQEHLHVLQREKIILEEKLKRALQEAENANKQLTNLATSVPIQDTEIVQDAHISYKNAEKGKNDDSDIDMKKCAEDASKKGQKPTKNEGSREDHKVSPSKSISEADELVHKSLAKNQAKQAITKSPGEMEETEEVAILSQKKDVKLGKKGLTEGKKSEDHGVSASELKGKYLFQEQGESYKPKELLSSMGETPRLPAYPSGQENIQYSSKHTDEKPTSLLSGKTQQMSTATRANRKSESPLKLDPKGLVTAKKTTEANEGISLDNSTQKEACGTTDSDFVNLPKIQGESESHFSLNYQDQLLPKSLNVHEDSPQLISERQKTAMPAKPSVQGQGHSLPLYENNMLPSVLPPIYQDVAPLKSSLSSHKTSSESQDAEEVSVFPVEKIPTLETQEKMPALTTQEDKKAPMPVLPVTHATNVTLETHSLEKKNLPWTQKEVVDVKELFSNAERLLLLTQMNKMQQASTLSLAEADLNTRRKTTELLHSMLAKLSPGVEDLQDMEAFEDSEIDSITVIAEDRLNKLPKLLASLESNLKDLQEALALADDQTGNISEGHGYELKRILATSLEAKLKDLQQVEAFIADQLGIRGLDEKQVYDIRQTRRLLLSSLELTLKDLQIVEANIISLPDSINEDRLKELINQKNILLSSLEENSQDLQQAQTIVVDQEDNYRFYEKKMKDLTEKRKLLLTSLESNWKDLQQTQALAASQLHGMNVGNKAKELIKERETLVAEIEENLKSLQEVENVVTSHLITDRFSENELLTKKRILLPSLPSALSSVQSADRSIAPAQPTYDNETTSHQMMPSKVVSKIHFDFSTLPSLVPEGRVQKASEIELPQKRKLMKKPPDISENKRDFDASTPYQTEWGALYICGKSYPLLSSKSQEAKRR
ncbi:coiled-coil domain-containing protein 7 isoform X1 [Dromaius novaehollandiae]|uniref:coiled-coil domain-containing protein 7 isoform X1 n=1 Tax=Dromaius novaehollandiae TaxID=8790 RepID=UPI00311D97CD